jgi:hypothetical protein
MSKDLIKELLRIDRLLFLGDKDGAHNLIQSLIEALASKESYDQTGK